MNADVVIVGGGPAGTAAAIHLAHAGRHVVLVEREAEAREKVCGEFLGADAIALLLRLGLEPATLGAVAIHGMRVAHRDGSAGIPLPFPAWGIPRRMLDEALLDRAERAGAHILRGRTARQLSRHGVAWRLRLSDGRSLEAPHTMLATGKHALRGFARHGVGWIGVKLHVHLRAPLYGVTLLPCAGGYAGLQPGPCGLANLCAALIPAQAAVAQCAQGFVAHVAAGSPLGAALLVRARPAMPRTLAIAGVPYGFMHRDAPCAVEGLWRLGDQFAVIPSFCGSGIAMALASGAAAAEALITGRDALAFHAAWRGHISRAMRVAGVTAAVLRTRPSLFSIAVAYAPSLARFVAKATRMADLPIPGSVAGSAAL